MTYLENVSGTYSAGKKTGAVGIDGSFAIGDAAGTYSGGVTVDCSPAS